MRWQFEITDCPSNVSYPVKATQVYDSGVVKGPFYLDIEHLIEALSKQPDNLLDADNAKAFEHNTPTLPLGTIRYSANKQGTRQRITMEIPKKQWEIKYSDDEKIYTIGFPRMVVQYLINQHSQGAKSISEMRIYAVEDNRAPITDDTPLYKFPYPNVGKSNGIVCWGQNERKQLNSLVELERGFLWFVSAPFNEDHGVATTFGIPNFKKLLNVIEDKEFSNEWLIPTKDKFSDLFK